ncbi:unnamed protein product [Phytophthora fragariaefolia]|uniref:Unnamed protein product n=1 Tax=Phytophthora fragariaefolia TaxID=1490495 RepID=A0A9W6WR88_9STRA|nr:unnamed protein product [Phytophthora fragariaefolia]
MPGDWRGPGNVVRWGSNALVSAVAASRTDVVRWLLDHAPHKPQREDLERAVANGDLAFAQSLLPRGRKLADYVGHLMHPRAVQLLLERGLPKENQDAAVGAIWVSAREGDLDLMKRVAAQHPKPPRGQNSRWLQFWEYMVNTACEAGDAEMIKWVMEHPTGKLLCKQMKDDTIVERYDRLLQEAATGGHIEAMEYLFEQGCTDYYGHAMLNAARKGNLNCIKWLLDYTYRYNPQGSANRVVVETAKLGYLDILKFFHAPLHASEELSPRQKEIEDSGTWWCRSRDAMDEAVANGQMEVAKWLYANRSEECTAAAVVKAARNGHLDMVKWLDRVMTADWTASVMDAAAQGGHLEVVKWLHANRADGCTMKAVENAIGYGNLHVASWLCWYYPEFVPAHDRLWMFPENLFDTLLFIQVNCPDVFTLEFGQGTKADLADEYVKGSEILVEKWLDANYPGRTTKERESFM